jgi:glycosyltransferase involved in cell wall biosynthesis
MRFLFIAPRYHTNQIGVIRNLKKKYKVFFNAIYKGKIEDYSLIKPFHIKQSNLSKIIEIIFKTKNKKILFFPNILECYRKFEKIKPDVAIIRLYGRLNPYISAIILRLLRTKIIFYEQAPNDLSHLKKKRFKLIFKIIELKLQNYVFNSLWMTPLKKNNFFFKNSFFLPFVVDIKKNIRSTKNFKILIIGKFQERKSIYLALKSLKKLKEKYKFKTTIIGEVSTKKHKEYYLKCKKFIIENNLNNEIKIITNLKYKKTINFYKNHHLFLLPSTNEPASISLLEAIGNSMPVICSDTCGTRFYVKSKFGKIFKTDNLQSLTNCINYFLKNKKNYKSYSNNAHIFACNNLSEKNYNFHLKKHVF